MVASIQQVSKSTQLLLDLVPLSWIPFLEKGLPKITEGDPFDPHWLISRINPASQSVSQWVSQLVTGQSVSQ